MRGRTFVGYTQAMDGTTPIIGIRNEAHSADAICADSANIENALTPRTEVLASTTAVSTTTVTLSWGGETRDVTSLAPYNYNGGESIGSTWRGRLYDHEVPASGVEIADSGILSAVPTYSDDSPIPEPFGTEGEPPQSLFTFLRPTGRRFVPVTYAPRSVEFEFTTLSPFAWLWGYLWAGKTYGLSEYACIDIKASQDVTRATGAKGNYRGAVSRDGQGRPRGRSISMPGALQSDASLLGDVSQKMGNSEPIFLQLFPTLNPQRDRMSEAGICHLTKSIKSVSLGSQHHGGPELASITISYGSWR